MYITKEIYEENAKTNKGNHWKSYKRRWSYFQKAIEYSIQLGITEKSRVLELGTMGSPVVLNSDTMDYFSTDGVYSNWNFLGKSPTFNHDARVLPWPIEDKKYDLFIALRVFQHLHPVQKECFNEVKRIAKNAIIVVPEKYRGGSGISREKFLEWNNDSIPDLFTKVYSEDNFIYAWKF